MAWRVTSDGVGPPRWLVVAAIGTALTVVASATSHAHPHPHSHGPSETAGHTTLEQTIIGEDQERVDDPPSTEFSFLRLGPGEPFTVREDLAEARSNRADRRRSIIYFGQMTDMQLVDVQSPGRVEWLDPEPTGFASSAFRPQEALVTHATELSIRQMNRFTESPIRDGRGESAEMVNAMMTGDLADNMQFNETLWVRQLFQGGHYEDGELVTRMVDPNSGSSDPSEYGPECQAAVSAGLLDPDDAEGYVGVQDYDDYPGGIGNPNYYAPEQPMGLYDDWPTYEGLMDRAMEPFEAEGLDVPSYMAFGNHDMLVQGNQWANIAFDELVRGCTKLFPTPSLLDAILPLANVPPAHEALPAFEPFLLNPPVPGAVVPVPPDPERKFIDRREFKEIFDNGFQDDAHGFALVDPVELEQSDGAASYYSFSPKPGIRYIVLDTVSYGGLVGDSSSGNIDHPQFQWLQRELEAAEERDELTIAFAHHGVTSLTSLVAHELAPPCRDPVTGADLQDVVGTGCDRDPRDSRAPGSISPHQGEDLRDLFHQFPNLIAFVAGHSHNNRVTPYQRPDGNGGFWEIKSPAVIDWPPQHRVIDVMDNRDGTLSIFAVMLDYTAPAEAPEGAEGNEVNGFDLEQLGAVARTLTYNDPQRGPDGGGDGPEGAPHDRNVELLIGDPRRLDDRDPPDREPRDPVRPPSDADDRVGPGDDAAPDDGAEAGRLPVGAPAAAVPTTDRADGRGLPFTGLSVIGLLAVAAALLLAGSTIRRLVTRS